jgi:hypothetical protein
VTVSTQVQGTVSAINVSTNPPTVTVGGQSYPISSITSINTAAASTANALSAAGQSLKRLL